MTSLPPKIDQRTSEDIIKQIEALAEDFTKEIEGGRWKPPGAIEVEVDPEKPELLSGLILNQNIAITVKKPTVANLTGQILNQDVDLGEQNIIKKSTLLNDDQAQKIVEKKESVEVLYTRNTLIDATLAQQISEVMELGQVKVKLQSSAIIEVERKYWIDQILAENINNDLKSGTVIDEDIAQEIQKQGRSKVKVKIENDAGEALIRIFARMVKSVSDRLNQVPEKNYLAFLELIGGQLKPPQPARVPLTFYLAEGSPVDGLVPAHTQVSAPPAEGSDEEIVFETDRELVVTTAQLQAVFVREPSQDKYSERTLEARGEKDETFLAFEGDRNIEHCLYITCPEIFDLPELPELNLIITGDTEKIKSLQEKLDWFYWDGSQWNQLTNPPTYNNDRFTFAELPIINASEINGQTARWLQAKLTSISAISENPPQITNIQGSITITQSGLIPEVCLFNNTPLDLSKDFYPFGEQPQLNDTFYIALDDSLIKPNVTIAIDITLSHKPENIDKDENNENNQYKLKITWEIENGQEWKEIAANNHELRWLENTSAIQFTEDNSISATLKFPNKENMPSPSTVNGETRYWIRARITQGHYGQPSKERKYTIYNEVATVSKDSSTKEIEIVGKAADLFSNHDVIRLVWIESNTEQREEHEISLKSKPNDESILTLETKTSTNNILKGTKIYRKSTVSETIPPTYDPPLIQSLKLSYEFTLTEDAIYFANNDFIYSHPQDDFQPFTTTIDQKPTLYLGFDQSFHNKTVTLYAQVEPPSPDESSQDITIETFLTKETNVEQKILELDDITGWKQGDIIEIKSPSQPKQYGSYTISNVDKNKKEITVQEDFQENYSEGSRVIYPKQPELVWEYSSKKGWQTLGVKDETKNFSQRGLIQFIAPADFSPRETFGKQLYWLRVRWQGGNFLVKPRLHRLLTNTMWAVQATGLHNEILGSSNADPDQVFVANYIPILPGQQLEIQEEQIPLELASDRVKVILDEYGEIESVWVKWQEVADLHGSGKSDRHYTLDRQTGTIRFGNGVAGMIPPRGRNNIRLSFYRTGGGEQGNIASETISELKTTIPYIKEVINIEASAGGAQQETLDRLKERVPQQIRHRDRAVTAQDMADLAYEASTDVARVKVVTPDLITTDFSPLNENFWLDPTKLDVSFKDILDQKSGKLKEREKDNFEQIIREINRRAGQVKLIILPYSKARQPIPSLALLEQVATYIRSRCEETTNITVSGPKWQEISVTVTVTPLSLEGVNRVRNSVKQRLESFLHPLTGGSGKGWQFGRHPEKSDFYAIIQAISGVDHVDSLAIDSGSIDANSSLNADTLIFSGNHTIAVSS